MNRELGTKWFVFYTKVRPWIACIFTLPVIFGFIQNFDIYFGHLWMMLSFVLTITDTILGVLVFIKSNADYAAFVRFVKGVLLFEIFLWAYEVGIEQYVKFDFDLATGIISAALSFVLFYLIWYRLNVKYFEKRMIPVPEKKDRRSIKRGFAVLLIVLQALSVCGYALNGEFDNLFTTSIGFFIGSFSPTIIAGLLLFSAMADTKRFAATRPALQEKAAQSGLSEFEYVKHQVSQDIIEFCNVCTETPEILEGYLDTLVNDRVISRLQADVLLEGYTDPASHAVAQPPQVPQPVSTVEPPKPTDHQIDQAELKKPSATPKTEPVAPAKRYCKLCGGVIDPQTKKCDKCGKQYFRAKKAWSIAGKVFVALAIVGLSFFSIFQTWNYVQCQSTISELEEQLAVANKTIDSQKKKLTEYEDTVRDKRVEISSLKKSLSFYQKYIVVVRNEYPMVYHRYECKYFQNSDATFRAYNIEAAKYNGYQACSYCIDE